MMYRVEHIHWVAGSGVSYNETVDNIDKLLTNEELAEIYGDYLKEEGNEDDWLNLIANGSNEVVSTTLTLVKS